MDRYKLTIGIECHVQLNTKTKLFSGASNDDRDEKPNTLVNQIDFGLPGELPVLNKVAIEKAIRAAFALNTSPVKYSTFDRKHYFYPDLPMGYQITQYSQPIINSGSVNITLEDKVKKINITRAHLEADAGKSLHPSGKNYSLVDLNRAGTPLLEIVSEPEMHSAAEARAYVRELWILMKFANVSNASLFYGNMRFDVNVSLSKTSELGTRTEIKNLNSFRSVEKAIEHEAERQLKLLKNNERIIQETRGWDDTKSSTYSLRSKENADDYRYMPDPDIPPIELDDTYVTKIKKSMPVMPDQWRKALSSYLDLSLIESLLQAEAEYSTDDLGYLVDLPSDQAKAIANWLINIEVPFREKEKNLELNNQSRHLMYKEVQSLFSSKKLNSNSAKELIVMLLKLDSLPKSIEDYAKTNNLIQQSDPNAIKEIVKKVLNENQIAVTELQNGETKVIGFLVGQVMKQSAGQANPSLATELIKEELGI